VASFGAAEQAAMGALQGGLGPPAERGSWSGATPFGTCPGPVRAVRWGRLYVLFTNGPTRYAPAGRWHLFAWHAETGQRRKEDPQDSARTPPPDAGTCAPGRRRPCSAARWTPSIRAPRRRRSRRRCAATVPGPRP